MEVIDDVLVVDFAPEEVLEDDDIGVVDDIGVEVIVVGGIKVRGVADASVE